MYIIRDMKENIVFITCTKFEGKLAEGLKICIEKYFDCNVFFFKESLGTNEWFKEIKEKLNNTKVHIVFATPISIERPWTYFEAGSTWIKEISPIVIRLFLPVKKLPDPLNRFWAPDPSEEGTKNIAFKLFQTLSQEFTLKQNIEDIKQGFAKEIEEVFMISNSEYTILKAFKDIIEREPGGLLHGMKIAPVIALLVEADLWPIDLNANTYDPKKLGNVIDYFNKLENSGIITKATGKIFNDIDDDERWREYKEYLLRAGFINRFSGNEDITRLDIITQLRQLKSTSFGGDIIDFLMGWWRLSI